MSVRFSVSSRNKVGMSSVMILNWDASVIDTDIIPLKQMHDMSFIALDFPTSLVPVKWMYG